MSPFEQAEQASVSFELTSDTTATVGKVNPTFSPWQGDPVEDDYGGKPILDIDGEPLFAELAILQELQSNGWDGGCWMDTYGRRLRTEMPPQSQPVQLPADREALLSDLRERNEGWSGAWDVFAWKEDRVLFAEAKRHGHDAIRESQLRWLEAALSADLDPESFLVVEWQLKG